MIEAINFNKNISFKGNSKYYIPSTYPKDYTYSSQAFKNAQTSSEAQGRAYINMQGENLNYSQRLAILDSYTKTDFKGETIKIFYDSKLAKKIAKDENAFNKTIELLDADYTDENGNTRKIFNDQNYITNLVFDNDKEKFDRAMALLEFTSFDSNGNEQRTFTHQNDIYGIAMSQENFNRAIDILVMNYTDSDGNHRYLFNDGKAIARIAENKLFVLDEEFEQRAVELAQITYIDPKSNRKERVFEDNCIANFANNRNFNIDDNFKQRAIQLAQATTIDSTGKKQRIFKNGIAIQLLSQDEKFDKTMKLLEYTYTDENGIERKKFDSEIRIANLVFDEKAYSKIVDGLK